MNSVPETYPQTGWSAPRTRWVPTLGVSLTRWLMYGRTFVLVAVLSAASYYAVSRFFVQTIQVVGVSMSPTLAENGRYLLNRWAFHDHGPRQSDIVVIRDPEDNGFSVKRVIATAGQSILFRGGKVFVDGTELREPYLAPGTHTYTYSSIHEEMITCGKDQYFVLGDNRLRSIDSRSYGPVSRENILGLVVVQ